MSTLSNAEIGSRIAQARKDKGLTAKELADKISVAASTITRYEKGSIAKIKLPVIEAIARALDVNPMWIIGKSDCITVKAMQDAWAENAKGTDQDLADVIKAFNDNADFRLLARKAIKSTNKNIKIATNILTDLGDGQEGEKH